MAKTSTVDPLLKKIAAVLTPLGIYLFAAAIRFCYIYESNKFPTYSVLAPGLDSDIYWRAALLINNPIESPNIELLMTSSPFFVALLATYQKVFGTSILTYRLIVAALLAFNSVLIFFITKKLLQRLSPAIAAALLFAAAPSSVHFDTIIAKPNLEIPLYLGIIALFFKVQKTREHHSLSLSALLGSLVAILCLLQPGALVLAGISFVFLLAVGGRDIKKRLYGTAIFSLTFLAIFLSANTFIKRQLPTRPMIGINLLLTLNPQSHGVYTQLPDIPTFLIGHALNSRVNAEQAINHRTSPKSADEYYQKIALNILFEQPTNSLRLALRKMHLFFNDFESKSEEFHLFIKSKIGIASWNPVSFGLLLVLSLFGLRYCFVNRRFDILWPCLAILCTTLAICVVLFPIWRYRAPAIIPLSILSGAGILYWTELIQQTKKMNWKLFAINTAILGMMTWSVFKSVHSSEYIEKTNESENGNLINAKDRKQWLVDASSVSRLNTNVSESPAEIVNFCKFHYYSYCYKKMTDFAKKGLINEELAWWYFTYLILLDNYDEARTYLSYIKVESPEIYQSIVSKKFRSDAITAVFSKYIVHAEQ